MKIFEDGCDVAELSFLRYNSSSSVLDDLKLLYMKRRSVYYELNLYVNLKVAI